MKNEVIRFLQFIMPFGMVTTVVAILIVAGVVFCYGYWRGRRGAQTVALWILGFDVVIVAAYMLLVLTGRGAI